MTSGAVVVDLDQVAAAGTVGAAWSLPHGGDLDANVVRLDAAGGIGEHVNNEVDVLVVGVSGQGSVSVDGADHPLHALRAVLVPKGSNRSITAGDGELIYLTVHRSRGGLQIR